MEERKGLRIEFGFGILILRDWGVNEELVKEIEEKQLVNRRKLRDYGILKVK